MKPIVILCGSDMCGKTQIAKALSLRLGVPYYKSNAEHFNFLKDQGRFINDLRFADPARLDLLKQLGTGIVFDRGYPCEFSYAKYFNRPTDETMLSWLDAEYSALGAYIVLCTRKSFIGIQDDLDPSLVGNALDELTGHYDEFLATSRCRHYKLFVDDENLDREVNEIISWMNGREYNMENYATCVDDLAGMSAAPTETLIQLLDASKRKTTFPNMMSDAALLCKLIQEISKRTDISEKCLEERLTSAYQNVAKDTKYPGVLQMLSGSKDPDVLSDVANNINTPTYILAQLARDECRDVRKNVAANMRCHDDVLGILSEDPEAVVRWHLVTNQKVPPVLLSKLSKDPEAIVRYHVANNPRTPKVDLGQLLTDPDIGVRQSAANNKNRP